MRLNAIGKPPSDHSRRTVIAWYANSYSPSIASIRLRCLAPIEALGRSGVETERYSPAHAHRYRTVVFSKTYDERALAVAGSLQSAGVRLVLDLCDNHFHGEDAHPGVMVRAGRLERMVTIADLVVASTRVLMDQLRVRFPDAAGKLALIPDYLESTDPRPTMVLDRLAIRRVDDFLSRHAGALHLIWFGNHGARPAPAGMADLLKVRAAIEAHAREHPVTLTVMSNSRSKYRQIIAPWSIPTLYLDWTLGRSHAALARHDVAVLPITPNPFTLAKTINRPATALLAGLGVIADAIPSYEELRPYIELDDWNAGLSRYSQAKAHDDRRIKEARDHLLKLYARERITSSWNSAISVRHHVPPPR